MNILALDTSMGVCGAAVLLAGGDAQRTVLCEESMARGHAEALMPMVAEAMAGAGIDFAELDLIAATLGPGSFTGVRIAIAAARGFALVTSAKLWGTNSLTVMARVALTSGAVEGGKPFAVAVDARGDRLYAGLYDGEGRKLDGPLLIGADEMSALLPMILPLPWEAVRCISLKPRAGMDASGSDASRFAAERRGARRACARSERNALDLASALPPPA